MQNIHYKLPETSISIDTAIEGVAYILYPKMMKKDLYPKGSPERDKLEKEIARLQRERDVIYGGGSPADYICVMNRVNDIYAPLIKQAITTGKDFGDLPD